MNLESFPLSAVSAVELATGDSLPIWTPVSAGGRTTFRTIFGLRIRTGGAADAIRFDPQASQLSVEFSPIFFDARGGSAPQAVVESASGGPIIVTLPVPMQLVRLQLSGIFSAATLELYRMDGDVIANEPTKQTENDVRSDDFIRVNGDGIGSVSARRAVKRERERAIGRDEVGEAVPKLAHAVGIFDIPGDFTDLRFGIKVTGYSSLNATNLSVVRVKSFPTGARLGIAPLPGPAEEIVPSFFHVIPGLVGKESGGPAGNVEIGSLLAEALQQHVDGLESPYPEDLDVLLVIESDAPCNFEATQFAIEYGLLRNSFGTVLLRPDDLEDGIAFGTRLREASTPLTAFLRAQLGEPTRNALDRSNTGALPAALAASIVNDLNLALQTQEFYSIARFADVPLKAETLEAAAASPTGLARTRVNRALLEEAFPRELAAAAPASSADKEVLRAKGASTSLDLKVDLPRDITVRAATLRLEGDLRADAPTPGNGGGVAGVPADAPISDAIGFSIDVGRAVANRITSSSAVEASGVSAALTITSPAAELVAELREDQTGEPAGRIVATATVTLQQLDRPAWVLFAFRSSVVLSAGTAYWIVLRAIAGSALWLAEQAAGTTRIGDPAAKRWTDRASFTELAPLQQLWSSTTALSNGSAARSVAERLRVAIGSTVVTPAANGGKLKTANITDALRSFLASAPGTGELVAAPLVVSAVGKGNLTVYPPEIEYDIPS